MIEIYKNQYLEVEGAGLSDHHSQLQKLSHKENRRERNRNWRAANREYLREYQRLWKAAHPEHVRAHRQKEFAERRSRRRQLRLRREAQRRRRALTRHQIKNGIFHLASKVQE